jgi:sulfite reductase alpha subunit-like flavoprotein
MRIHYVHASKFGNGARVAEYFARDMAARGVEVAVFHVRDVDPAQMGDADMYLFSSPGRMGKPIRSMRRFLKDLRLPAGTRYAILTTEMAPRPDKDGRMPTEEDICRWQRVRPIMNQLLGAKGLVQVAENVVYVTDLKGPLEDGWEEKVRAFAARVCEAMEVPA